MALTVLFSVVLVLIALWIRNGMAESQEFEAQQSQASLQPEKSDYRWWKPCFAIRERFY